jgi:phospholipid/cholesterol/gamma-HCH transport system permease protein
MAATATIQLDETFDRSTAPAAQARLLAALRDKPGELTVDLSKVQRFDSAGVAALIELLVRARAQQTKLHFQGMSRGLLDYFSLLSVERLLQEAPRPRRSGFVEGIGNRVLPAARSLKHVRTTLVSALGGLLVAPFKGERLRLDRITVELHIAANGSVPIVALIAFLMGLILAMQAWVQLRVWGAEMFVADAVGVSVTTEIGPLMTAILLAARSGSSMAAQLGTMVVSEEVDALRQMGISPRQFLITPKVVALAVAVPMLTVVFDLVAMAGGAFFATTFANIEIQPYLTQTQIALKLNELLLAALKCTIFGGLIGVVACSMGLHVEGGAEGVGRATTDAVVVSIFLVIVVDAIFVALQRIGFA